MLPVLARTHSQKIEINSYSGTNSRKSKKETYFTVTESVTVKGAKC